MRDDFEEFERYFVSLVNQMINAFARGASGVRITVDGAGNVRVDSLHPRRRRIYVPFEVVDAGEEYLVTLDLRSLPKRATVLRVLPDGVLVETPRGERFIYFEEPVDPDSARYEESNDVIELYVKKGEGKGEKVIRFPQ